jgi:hypothetical protein
MDDTLEDSNHWLERARDARTIAKRLKDDNMKNIMEDIAISYERIADHAARKLKDAGHASG